MFLFRKQGGVCRRKVIRCGVVEVVVLLVDSSEDVGGQVHLVFYGEEK